ncbi:MAG: N-6 DNA methylase, partial [Candidatus Korobacteraceae bacterium]
QVVEMMDGLSLREQQILELVTDWELLTQLARVEKRQARDVARFLAAYIFLSQVLFLRLFSSVHSNIVPKGAITRHRLQEAFGKVLEINYRPIFKLDVLDAISDQFLQDTFTLIWGMQVERVRYELPGRLFHALMPAHIRKLLAAFYTRPQSAELLARLTLQHSDGTVVDPACGSGTILTAAYRRKLEIYRSERRPGNPHRRFCQEEIYGSDIMPFAVHLTCANLAAMDVAETIDRTLILQGDSLDVVSGKRYVGGVHQLGLYTKPLTAKRSTGEEYEVVLPSGGVDAVLMNPPFTKVERRIADYVDMDKFKEVVGGEVGLWGHFLPLADSLLQDHGICGAVLPINLFRGRESTKVRQFVFENWSPKYIIKSTRSYAFSESAEYRDILLIAEKTPSTTDCVVKVCYVKKNLATLTQADVEYLGARIESRKRLRSNDLDIDSHTVKALTERSPNMLWFLGCENLNHRDQRVDFCGMFTDRLLRFPQNYFREGYRPVPKGVSKFMFLTRATNEGRVEEAFLRFTSDRGRTITASTGMGATFSIDKADFTYSVRTQVGLARMDITDNLDYLARHAYKGLSDVKKAAGFTSKLPKAFWEDADAEMDATATRTVVAHRLDYGSPNLHLVAWHSKYPFSPSNQLNVVQEDDERTAQAVCVLFNSAIFLAHLFLLKEQSHARYANLRFYDFYEMPIFPPPELRTSLQGIFEKYRHEQFPALRYQLDENYDARFGEYWESQEEIVQGRLWTVLDKPAQPSPIRLAFDRDVCKVLGVPVSVEQLRSIYRVIAEEMIITRRLAKE